VVQAYLVKPQQFVYARPVSSSPPKDPRNDSRKASAIEPTLRSDAPAARDLPKNLRRTEMSPSGSVPPETLRIPELNVPGGQAPVTATERVNVPVVPELDLPLGASNRPRSVGGNSSPPLNPASQERHGGAPDTMRQLPTSGNSAANSAGNSGPPLGPPRRAELPAIELSHATKRSAPIRGVSFPSAATGNRASSSGIEVEIARVPSKVVRPPAEPKKPRRSFLRRAFRFMGRAFLVCLVLGLIGCAFLWNYVRELESTLPSIADVRASYKPAQVTRVLARDGSVLAELFTERRTVIPIGSLPAHVKLAVLAAEDASFYEHEGLNYWGILRAAIVNVRSGHLRQGGSTITQQVVKNIILDSERTMKRKLKEALLARKLEQELKKDEILELYLNHIYFGHARYGIEEASRDLFAKSAKDLSISEVALVAGIIACPETCSPRKDIKKALDRRRIVLERMRDKGFLTDVAFDAAKDDSVQIAPVTESSPELAAEVIGIVRKTLHDLAPDRSLQGGFVVTTTIDPKLQAAARKAVRDNLASYDKRHALLGPIKLPPELDPKNLEAAKDPKQKKKLPKPNPKDAVFEGMPNYDAHKALQGEVVDHDDAAGTLDVRVGQIVGVVKLADYERYNPQKLKPSEFAPKGARLRVSLLAPAPTEGSVPAAPGSAAQVKDSPPAASPSGTGKTVPTGQPSLPPTTASSDRSPSKVASKPLKTPLKTPLRLELGPETAFVAIDLRSRDVVALVGNYEARAGALDRATQSRRQPGSTFKPIVYSYALHSKKYTPASMIDVTITNFGDYKPSNYEGWTAKDPMRLREVLANSVNIGAVRVLEDVGPMNVVDWGKALGIRTPMKPDLSLALGSYEVEPIDLAAVYATMGAGGVYEEPRIISKIVGPDGKELELPPRTPSRRVLDDAEAYLITHMMGSVIDHGTARGAKALGRPAAGKTGTSNGSKDTWFAGYTTDLAAVVWVGYDDGRLLGGNEAGGVTALPAWTNFMKAAHVGKPATDFPRPAGITFAKIDKVTGKLPYPDDPDVLDEVFLAGTEPKEISEVRVDAGAGDASVNSDSGSNSAGADAGLPALP
jgi:penicillin-binding protein 1A